MAAVRGTGRGGASRWLRGLRAALPSSSFRVLGGESAQEAGVQLWRVLNLYANSKFESEARRLRWSSEMGGSARPAK